MSLIARSLLIAAAFAGPALGAGEDGSRTLAQAQLEIMDTDGDGKVSATEHTLGSKKIFEMMDANQNGMVTPEEMDAGLEKMGVDTSTLGMSSARMIDSADKNQDGELSAEEDFTASRKLFDEMDEDGDRILTLSELHAGHELRQTDARHAHEAD